MCEMSWRKKGVFYIAIFTRIILSIIERGAMVYADSTVSWSFSPTLCLKYYVITKPFIFDYCQSSCRTVGNNAELAIVKPVLLDTLVNEIDLKDHRVWVSGPTSSLYSIEWSKDKPRLQRQTNGKDALECLCQKNVINKTACVSGPTSSSSPNSTSSGTPKTSTSYHRTSSKATTQAPQRNATPVASFTKTTRVSASTKYATTMSTSFIAQNESISTSMTSLATTDLTSSSTAPSSSTSAVTPARGTSGTPVATSGTPWALDTSSQETPETKSARPAISPVIKPINNSEYYIVTRPLTCKESRTFARLFNVTLAWYTSVAQYLNMATDLELPVGQYWIGGEELKDVQLYLIVRNGSSVHISMDTCDSRHGSVYRRVGNITIVLSDPDFVKALTELTVDAKTTQVAKRKLISVQDTRTSAVTMGGTVAVTVILAVLCLMGIMDLPHLRQCQCRKNCKTRRIKNVLLIKKQ